jgi:outer membrane receptor for ferric coprogen and ferric-rhodotorulic acid
MLRSTPQFHRRPLSVAIQLIFVGGGLLAGAWTHDARAQNVTPAGPAVLSYDIKAGPLSRALTDFSAQAGILIVGASGPADGKNSPGLRGAYSPSEALQLLLAGTGLEAVRQADGSYSLRTVPASVSASGAAVTTMPAVTVSAERNVDSSNSYTVGQTSSATRMNLSPRETPQSITVVTRAKMDDFQLNTINDVLASTAGVTVEKVETERTYFTSRGFSITNFQYDGIGVPLTYGTQAGDIDTALYDRIEIVRGANGLSSSTGDPSATINFIRKRPTYGFQASANVAVSSWNTKRFDADISGALNDAGTVAARVVAAHQEGDSYLDRYKPSKDLFYGVIEANLSDSTLLTVGYSYQKVHGKGAMWGALPLADANGVPVEYGVGTNSASDWAYYNSTEQRAFAELSQQLGRGWLWKSTVADNSIKSDSALLYLGGALDPATDTGFFAFPSLFNSTNKQFFVDSNVSGKYSVAGREHELSLGASWSRSKQENIGFDTATGYYSIGGEHAFDGSFPYPEFSTDAVVNAYADRRKTVYGATRLNLDDRVKLLLGANYTKAESTGASDGVSRVLNQSAFSPYAGLVVDLTQNISTYASLSKIFNPQYNMDINRVTLAAARGKSYELGLKGEFLQKRLNASTAVFSTEQNNIAETAGVFDDGQTYYTGIKAKSEGVEFDLSGELSRNWQASAGAVIQRITGVDGDTVRTYIPRRQLRLSSTYRLPQFDKLKFGASLNIQSKTAYSSDAAVQQGGYALLNLMSHYEINKNLSLSVNVNNVLDKKYLASVNWSQSYYAPPANGSVSLNWKY